MNVEIVSSPCNLTIIEGICRICFCINAIIQNLKNFVLAKTTVSTKLLFYHFTKSF